MPCKPCIKRNAWLAKKAGELNLQRAQARLEARTKRMLKRYKAQQKAEADESVKA